MAQWGKHPIASAHLSAYFATGRVFKAYEACLSATSTANAPGHVVPADDKKNARLIISEILLDVFTGLKMAYPEPTVKRRRELQLIRKTQVKLAMGGERNLTKALAYGVGLYPIANTAAQAQIGVLAPLS